MWVNYSKAFQEMLPLLVLNEGQSAWGGVYYSSQAKTHKMKGQLGQEKHLANFSYEK